MGKFAAWLHTTNDANWMMIGACGMGALLSAGGGAWGAAALFVVSLAGQALVLYSRRSRAAHE